MTADGTTTAWEYYLWDSSVSWNKRTSTFDFRNPGELETVRFATTREALNHIGAGGWELVSVYWVPGVNAAVHTFKRPKDPVPPA